MTHDQFVSLVERPKLVDAEHVVELKEMVEQYPFFAHAHVLYAKALQQSGSVLFAAKLKCASIYIPSREALYYYMNPEKMVVAEPYRRETKTKSSGDYFDMISSVESEGGDTRQSLRKLAEKLKSARAMVASVPRTSPRPEETAEVKQQEIKILSVNKVVDEIQQTTEINNISELNAKKLISERKYSQAIEILKALNLNNPKKSVYFADQIRFLEKILANSKK
jgi:hypothetical protein